jgi:hypothetical protein
MVINGMLTVDGLRIQTNSINHKQLNKIKRILTVACRQFSGWVKQTKAYSFDDSGNIVVPRFTPLVIEWDVKIKNKLHRGRGAQTLNQFDAVLTPNQIGVRDAIMNNEFSDKSRKDGLAGLVVNMPPGQGKTFLAMGIMHRIKRKTAVIVPNTLVLKQWFDLCTLYFPDATIGQYHGKKKIDGDIVILIVNSSTNDEFTFKHSDGKKRTLDHEDWWKRFGLVVYDEVHMYCSDNRAIVFQRAQSQYVLGLSATPNQRLDKLSVIAQWHIGPVLDALQLESFAVQQVEYKTEVRVVKYRCETEYAEVGMTDTGTVSVPRTVNIMVKDPVRNQIIINEALRLYAKGLCIFVFTDRRGHAKWITDTLKKYTYEIPKVDFRNAIDGLSDKLCDNVWDYLFPEPLCAITMLGGSSDDIINQAKTTSRVITTTYQYSSTGVSIDKLNATILATPRKNGMTQILGRIYRLAGDSSVTRQIVDIVDWSSPLKKQHYERRKVYNKDFKAKTETIEIISKPIIVDEGDESD